MGEWFQQEIQVLLHGQHRAVYNWSIRRRQLPDARFRRRGDHRYLDPVRHLDDDRCLDPFAGSDIRTPDRIVTQPRRVLPDEQRGAQAARRSTKDTEIRR
jgi:hypothetical protein